MNTEKRLNALKDMAARHGLAVRVTLPDQREPETVISLLPDSDRFPQALVRVTSRDGLAVALGLMESRLTLLTNLKNDLYFQQPHRMMGRV
jgi:hypothetical protein